MGPETSEEDVGRNVPTRGGSKIRRASSSGVHDDISQPLPPPAVKLKFPVQPTSQLAGPGLLSQADRHPAEPGETSSFRDEYITQDQTRANGLETSNPSLELGRSSSVEGNSMGQYPANNDESSETTALLTHGNSDASRKNPGNVSIAKDWDETEGKITTTWKTELLVLVKYSLPLMLTCVLQYSLSGASVVAVGHLGKTELGAVSLAIMTSNVTGYCAYAGLATSLDTLCAQAYGSGKPQLVGLQLQRMVYFLWIITIPIAAVWLGGTQILLLITPERQCAELAGLFLKILIFGAPSFAMFEAGKRFVQAQGLFNANLYVLLICAPLNAFMNWLFVWVWSIGPPS